MEYYRSEGSFYNRNYQLTQMRLSSQKRLQQ
uniref:Uncharacterized protein n=1 Tax=Arundo donax TaxID=35708 RepID=A0A0A9EWV3_ARUDO